jgi:sucrose-6-phosphate hydrolase SacC (GH32 family)
MKKLAVLTVLMISGLSLFSQEIPAMPEVIPDNWLTYHLAHPGPGIAEPGDPNCAFYYKGRYHLHYIYKNKEGWSFAHVSSSDMVNWKWHPTVLTPAFTGHGMFSGTGFFTKEGQPAIIYHGEGAQRNFISFALDDNLDVWSKPMPVEPKTASGEDEKTRQWDPDCWLNGDTYYAISGGAPPHLIKSGDLKNWSSLGLLFHEDMPDLGVSREEDVSCANMFKIGNKWMLLCISHKLCCRYYLGDFKDEKYLPDFHANMHWGGLEFFAPESLLTRDGRRVMWAWCITEGGQSGIQSLPRELTLPEDGILRIKPLRELEKLRYDRLREGNINVLSGENKMLRVRGDILELNISIKPTPATEFGVTVFCDQFGHGLPVTIKPGEKIMMLGTVRVPFDLGKEETLNLRIFLDRGMVEVFLNDRQAVAGMQVHEKENTGISLFSKGGDLAGQVTSWKMKSIYN